VVLRRINLLLTIRATVIKITFNIKNIFRIKYNSNKTNENCINVVISEKIKIHLIKYMGFFIRSATNMDTIKPINSPKNIAANAKYSLSALSVPIIIKSKPICPNSKNIKEFKIRNKVKKSLFEISISLIKNLKLNGILCPNKEVKSSVSSSILSILLGSFTERHLIVADITNYLIKMNYSI